MTMWKRIVCGVMTACMVLAAGCSGQDRTWAYQVGEQQMPVGVYIYYQINGVANAQKALMDANADNADFTMPETHKELLKQEIDGQTVEEYITAEAQTMAKDYFAVEQEFAARKLSLTEDELTYAANTASNAYGQNTEYYADNGIAESSLRLIIENDLKRQALFNQLYGKGGEQEADDEELRAYFLDNYAKADMMIYSISAEGDAASAGRKDAEDFLKRVQNGEDFYDVANEVKKAEFEAQQAAATDTQLKEYTPVGEGGMAILLVNNEEYRTNYGDTLVDGMFAAKIGEPVKVEDSKYVYIINRLDLAQTDDFTLYRDQVLYEAKDGDFTKWLTEKAEAMEMTANEAAISYHTPSRLQMDTEK